MEQSGRLLCVFSALILLYVEGLPDVIQTQQIVTAAVGGEAHFCCRLLEPRDVRQVTWQKLSAAGEKDLASSNKFFGQRVNRGFAEKVAFEDASLQNCSIVLRRVEVQDEGCYRCLFNIYPDGAIAGRTCLQLQELHEPLLNVSIPDPSAVHRLVECRATGRPAPTVTLSVSQPGLRLSNHSSVSVPNGNGTITVHASALLWDSPPPHGATVQCSVQLQSGPQRQTFVTLPESPPTSEKSERQTASHQTRQNVLLWLVLPALVLLIFIIAAALVILRRQQKKSEPQIFNTPQREAQHLPGQNQTPLRQRSTEQMRNRTPRRLRDCMKLHLSVARPLFSQKKTVDL